MQSSFQLNEKLRRRFEILCRFWQELIPDLADWLLRCNEFPVTFFGLRCLQAALQKAAQYERIAKMLVPQAQSPMPKAPSPLLPLRAIPQLTEDQANVLGEMADARTQALFFSSYVLFWDPVMQEAAELWAAEAQMDAPGAPEEFRAALRELAAPSLEQTQADRILSFLYPEQDSRGEAFRWAGHLVDILSAAGGFHAVPAPAESNEEEDYRWGDQLPAVDQEFLQWEEQEVAAGEIETETTNLMRLLLFLFENWRTLEKQLSQNENQWADFVSILIQAINQGVDALEKVVQLPDAALPVKLDAGKFRQFASLSLQERMNDLTTK